MDNNPYKKKYQKKISEFEKLLAFALMDLADTTATLDFDITDSFEFVQPYVKEILYNTLIQFSPSVLKKMPENYQELTELDDVEF